MSFYTPISSMDGSISAAIYDVGNVYKRRYADFYRIDSE